MGEGGLSPEKCWEMWRETDPKTSDPSPGAWLLGKLETKMLVSPQWGN